MRVERGIGADTIRERKLWARAFLEARAETAGVVCWAEVDARRVNQYIAERGRGYSLSSRRHLVDAMRSLSRWAWANGLLDRDIGAAVLRPPPRRSADLPRALTAAQAVSILAAADTSTPIGVRDYAVVLMLTRLGLRAGEVAALSVDDIDWRRGQLLTCGKNERQLSLPLPVDVGEALVDYLRRGRPAVVIGRTLFVRMRPPHGRMSSAGISDIVARLATRAGLGTVHAHRLRHTAATAVLGRGGSLVESRELLGHARTDTTMVYAKTDLAALCALVLPWGRVP